MKTSTYIFPTGGKFRIGKTGLIVIEPGKSLSGVPYFFVRNMQERFHLVLADGRTVKNIRCAKVKIV